MPFSQKKLWIIGTVCVLPFVLIGAGYLLAGPQAVSGQDAVEDAKDKELAKKAALVTEVRNATGAGVDGWTWTFSNNLSAEDLEGVAKGFFSGNHEKAGQQAAKLGGVRTGLNGGFGGTPVSRHKVTLIGNRSTKVHITGMRAYVLSEHPAPLGTLLVGPSEGGGPIDSVYIDLDSQRRVAVTTRDGKPTKTPFVLAQNRWAEEDEPLDFLVTAGTERKVRYEWELRVDVSYDGKKETVKVRKANGEPFTTVGWDFYWPYKSTHQLNLEVSRIAPFEG